MPKTGKKSLVKKPRLKTKQKKKTPAVQTRSKMLETPEEQSIRLNEMTDKEQYDVLFEGPLTPREDTIVGEGNGKNLEKVVKEDAKPKIGKQINQRLGESTFEVRTIELIPARKAGD